MAAARPVAHAHNENEYRSRFAKSFGNFLVCEVGLGAWFAKRKCCCLQTRSSERLPGGCWSRNPGRALAPPSARPFGK
jgi:hypothetical protein